MTVKFGKKDYQTVQERLIVFFSDDKYKDMRITTTVHHQDSDRIIMRAEITDLNCRVLSSGTASRDRGSDTFTNKDTEKCETNAVGRALAFLSAELMGEEIASADEVSTAVTEKNEKELYSRFAETTQANERNHDSLLAIREFLSEDNFEAAKEAWLEVPDKDKHSIWVATTKGGWFNPRERQQMKYWSNDFELKRNG